MERKLLEALKVENPSWDDVQRRLFDILKDSKRCSAPVLLVVIHMLVPAGFSPSVLTTVVGFDSHSSLVRIRTRLTPETTLSKMRNIFLINGAIECTGTPMGAHVVMALLRSAG